MLCLITNVSFVLLILKKIKVLHGLSCCSFSTPSLCVWPIRTQPLWLRGEICVPWYSSVPGYNVGSDDHITRSCIPLNTLNNKPCSLKRRQIQSSSTHTILECRWSMACAMWLSAMVKRCFSSWSLTRLSLFALRKVRRLPCSTSSMISIYGTFDTQINIETEQADECVLS